MSNRFSQGLRSAVTAALLSASTLSAQQAQRVAPSLPLAAYSINHAYFLERTPACAKKKDVFVLRDVSKRQANGVLYGCLENVTRAAGFYVPADTAVQIPVRAPTEHWRPNFERPSLCETAGHDKAVYDVTNELQKHRGEVEVCTRGNAFDARGKLNGFRILGFDANAEISVQGLLNQTAGAQFVVRAWPSKGPFSLKRKSIYLRCEVNPDHAFACTEYKP